MSFKKRKQRPASPVSGAKQMKRVSGTLTVHRDGFGFVAPDSGGEDVFVPARYLRESMHGDRVEVEVQGGGRGGKREGRVVATRERSVKRVVGIFRLRRSGAQIQPSDDRLPWLTVSAGATAGATDGQVVVADIVAYPGEGKPPAGRVTEVLGQPDDPAVELLMVIRKYELPDSFPAPVLKEARGVSQSLTEYDLAGRTDLRDLTIVTVDGETARDFDDAVAVRREGANIRLWVSIADVAHYVRPGSALDKEAYLRGTSVYFPDRCLPMLPEELSNGICSLNPQVDRLTMTAEMLFSPAGDMLSAGFYPSVINSSARLTYTLVSRIIEHDDPEVKAQYPHLVADLLLMKELALILAEMRRARGSIDFDLPEAEIVMALSGKPEAIIRAERNLAHRLIESFMLAANEAVAARLTETLPGTLYRVHEPPEQEKLLAIAAFFSQLGYPELAQAEPVAPRDIQALLAHVEGHPEERLINRMLLRSMKQARYAAENYGHFGLAASCYTHFTSPIRRYPDLVVHRLLKWLQTSQPESARRGRSGTAPFPGYPALLTEIGEHTSRRERVAMEAEREIVELKKVQIMAEKLGEEFDGFVNGVSQFGIFVELGELFVEGLVHISTLPSDYYTFIENEQTLFGQQSGVRYRIGDPVRVKVAAVNRERRQIDFVLACLPAPAARQSTPVGAVEDYTRKPVKGKRPEGFGRGGRSQPPGGKGKSGRGRR